MYTYVVVCASFDENNGGVGCNDRHKHSYGVGLEKSEPSAGEEPAPLRCSTEYHRSAL